MRRWSLLLAACIALCGQLTAQQNRTCTLAGRTWLAYPQALQQAREQGRPLLLVQMLGDLSEEWC